MKVELIPGDGKQVLTKYRARNHDIYIGQWGPDYQDPHTNAETFAMNVDNTDDAEVEDAGLAELLGHPRHDQADPGRGEGARRQEARGRSTRRSSASTRSRRPSSSCSSRAEVAAHSKDVDGFVMGPSFENNLYAGIKK